MNKKQQNLVDYLKESTEKSKKLHKERIFLDNIIVIIKDYFINDINLDKVLDKVKKYIPNHLFVNIEAIYIGQFKELIDRDLTASYMDGAIYITNEQQNEQIMFEDIVHEVAHSVEDISGFSMYEDNKINREFLSKRMRLKSILKEAGYEVDHIRFDKTEYDKNFDMYLYKSIGYDVLNNLVVGLFCSPYGATSIREYFANGFEHYFTKSSKLVKEVSPQLYIKLIELEKNIYTGEETDDMSY
jgi:hypothetical protein